MKGDKGQEVFLRPPAGAFEGQYAEQETPTMRDNTVFIIVLHVRAALPVFRVAGCNRVRTYRGGCSGGARVSRSVASSLLAYCGVVRPLLLRVTLSTLASYSKSV